MAGGKMTPQRLHLTPQTDGWVDLRFTDHTRNIVLLVEDRVVNTCLNCRVVALGAIGQIKSRTRSHRFLGLNWISNLPN